MVKPGRMLKLSVLPPRSRLPATTIRSLIGANVSMLGRPRSKTVLAVAPSVRLFSVSVPMDGAAVRASPADSVAPLPMVVVPTSWKPVPARVAPLATLMSLAMRPVRLSVPSATEKPPVTSLRPSAVPDALDAVKMPAPVFTIASVSPAPAKPSRKELENSTLLAPVFTVIANAPSPTLLTRRVVTS